MQFLNNGNKIYKIELQQYSVNVDALTFIFKKPKNFNIDTTIPKVLIDFDKAFDILDPTVSDMEIKETEDNIELTYTIQDGLTYIEGEHIMQIALYQENPFQVFYSPTIKFYVNESLEVENKVFISNISQLTFYDKKIKEILKQIENGLNVNLDDLTPEQIQQITPKINESGNWEISGTDTQISAKGENGKSAYEIWLQNSNTGSEQDFINSLKGENGVVDTTLFYNKSEVDNKLKNKVDKETYTEDKNTFALKTDLESKLNKETYENDKQSFITNEELQSKLDVSTYERDKQSFAIINDIEEDSNTTYSSNKINELMEENKIDFFKKYFSTLNESNVFLSYNNTFNTQEEILVISRAGNVSSSIVYGEEKKVQISISSIMIDGNPNYDYLDVELDSFPIGKGNLKPYLFKVKKQITFSKHLIIDLRLKDINSNNIETRQIIILAR